MAELLTFDVVKERAQIAFPKLKIAYKDKSSFMKLLGKIMFFNPGFMTTYTTTIGNTVYFPNEDATTRQSAIILLMHELVHVADAERSHILFSILYLFPQILCLLAIPILFLFGWKLAFIPLLFLLPIPSYFRMQDEKKGYTISLYTMNKLGLDPNDRIAFYTSQFKLSTYYFTWPFSSINTYFIDAAVKIKAGERPNYEPSLYDTIDKILA